MTKTYFRLIHILLCVMNLDFNIFHKSQIPFILKQITKYLGKKHNILSLCPELHHNKSVVSTMYFIEELIFGNNHLLPHMSSSTYV